MSCNPYTMDAYENDHHVEALEAFERFCKFNAEQACKAMAYAYLELECPDAMKVWHDLGLERKHAMIICGRTKDFWDQAYEDEQEAKADRFL